MIFRNNPKIHEAVASRARPQSHDLRGCEGGCDEVGIFVAVLRHGPLSQGLSVFTGEPLEALLQFLGEESLVEADAGQHSFAKVQHIIDVEGVTQSCGVVARGAVMAMSRKLKSGVKAAGLGLAYLCRGMKRRHNKEDRRVLMARMEQDGVPRTTLSFYRYVRLENPDQTRNQLYAAWEGMGVLGRTYVASEGINAQISVPTDRFDEFKAHLDSLGWLPNLRLNVAVEQGKSFFKLIVRVKEKIVADGLNDDTFDVTDCGEHLKADQFNALTDHEDTVLIDMRNSYESEVGHFEGAICPDVNTFREEIVLVESMLQDKKDANIVMYCTGGIRCEKASAYLKHKGFPNVHQLEGGIIEYTRQAKESGIRNKFVGKNFVFDERLAERISDEVIAKCHTCGTPCDEHVNCANPTCNILMIQCPSCRDALKHTCSESCKLFIELPEEEQRARRKGTKARGGFMTGGNSLSPDEQPTPKSRQ